MVKLAILETLNSLGVGLKPGTPVISAQVEPGLQPCGKPRTTAKVVARFERHFPAAELSRRHDVDRNVRLGDPLLRFRETLGPRRLSVVLPAIALGFGSFISQSAESRKGALMGVPTAGQSSFPRMELAATDISFCDLPSNTRMSLIRLSKGGSDMAEGDVDDNSMGEGWFVAQLR